MPGIFADDIVSLRENLRLRNKTLLKYEVKYDIKQIKHKGHGCKSVQKPEITRKMKVYKTIFRPMSMYYANPVSCR